MEVRYRPVQEDSPAVKNAQGTPQKEPRQKSARETDRDLMEAIVDAVDELCREGSGDVLVFLPGEREIRDAAEALRKHHPPHTEILPLFARLSAAEQERVFKPSNARRIVLATNVAETSLTVPGIRYVVDTGLARVKRYSATATRSSSCRSSRSRRRRRTSARAAAGASRTACASVCTTKPISSRACVSPIPEILRSSLAAVILRMKSLHLTAIETFPFLEPPPGRAIADGYQLLNELGAVDDDNALTPLGRELARLPLDPRVGRMILAARDHQALREVLIIAAALSVQDPRDRPIEAQEQARPGAPEVRRRAFRIPAMDAHLGLVRGRDRAQEVEQATDGRVPREFPVAFAPARVARRAFAIADGRARAWLAAERIGGDVRAGASVALDRLARQRRPQSRRRAVLPRRARHQVLSVARVGVAEESAGAG